MIQRRFIAAVALLCALVAPAYGQSTKAQLNTLIGTEFPNNTTGAITPTKLRNVSNSIVNSIMPTAPVVSGNLACFNGTTGLLQDCGLSPSTFPLVVGTTPVAGATNKGILFNNTGILGDIAPAGAGTCLTSNGSSSDPSFQGCPQVFNVKSYATPQLAVDAAAAVNGGIVDFGCGTYSLGSGAVGLNLDGIFHLRLTGSGQQGGGGTQCVRLNYTGTGTAISAKGVSGLEIDHLFVVASTSAKVIDLATGINQQSGGVFIHDNTLVGQTGVSVILDAASSTQLRVERNTFASGTVGIRGITSGGGIGAGQFLVNTNITNNNSFQPSLTVAAIQGLNENAVVTGNVFQGQITAYASGPAGTCIDVVWSGNWHGDSTVPQNLIQSNCQMFTSIGNFYVPGGGTAITQANSTGSVASVGDKFFTGTAFAMGTGNFLTINGIPSIDVPPTITGTPTINGVPSQLIWGSLAVNTTFTDAPFSVAAYSDNVQTGPAIKIYASDRVTTGGTLSFNKASGVAGEAQIASADSSGIAPIRFTTGDVRLGGVFAGNRAGTLRFEGSTSGTVFVTPQAVAGTPTLTLPNASGTFGVTATSPVTLNAATGDVGCATCGVTGNPLSQFAATTSAQLRGVISDETGTGPAVFAGGNIGAATGTLNAASIDNLAWTAYTPTASSAAGSFASTGTTGVAAGKYKLIGKTLFFVASCTVSVIGTASGYLVLSLPAGLVATNDSAFAGSETALTGQTIGGQIVATGNNMFIRKYDATSPFGLGAGLKAVVTGSIEVN